MYLNPWRTGLAFGGLLGIWHALWAALVAFGLAQPLLDFILFVHFIEMPARIAPFGLSVAAALVVFTGVFGFLFGALFASVWNWLQGQGARTSHSIPAL